MKKLMWVFVCLSYATFTAAAFAQDADDIIGLWITAGGDSYIEIYKKGKLYFGRIAALKKPNYEPREVDGMSGQPRIDRNNPDASLRDRPLIGLELMTNFLFEDGIWRNGRIYNPRNGKTYRSRLKLTKSGELKVRGYIGFFWLGGSSVWRRASE
jgi:uncharacterized protein (DUF2147 family)